MEEILFWNKLNAAYASFCVSTLQSSKSDQQELISTMVGDELDWCKCEALVSMTALHGLLQQRSQEMESNLKETDKLLTYERETSSSLRKQIKMLQLSAEDTAWELQEQLAHATNTLQVERDAANEIKEQLETTQAKLVEVKLKLLLWMKTLLGLTNANIILIFVIMTCFLHFFLLKFIRWKCT